MFDVSSKFKSNLHYIQNVFQRQKYYADMYKNSLNFLLNNKILDMTKLKAFPDEKLNVARMMISSLDRVENTVGKEENACYQHFLLFLQCFPQPSSLTLLKVGIVW